jgi:hypothetical protein
MGVVMVAALVAASPSLGHGLEGTTGSGSTGTFVPEPTAESAATRPAATTAAEPLPQASPRANCGPGSQPETGIQGRVPANAPADGFRCNISQLSHEGTAGGFKVERFVDRAGHECAYYDTTLLFPTNLLPATLNTQLTGTAVLDMSDPAKPVRTATLQTPAMQSPHESLLLNQKRGLLAAVFGNPAFGPGVIDIYDVNEDCRHPALQSSLPVGVLGHESGFAPDGKTFYATSLGTGQVTAVDVTNPKLPVTLFVGNFSSHGLTISQDGNRAYLAASDGLLILDVSEIQARKPNPQAREVSFLTWSQVTIPQVALPVTIGGKPMLVEIDEFAANESGSTTANGPRVGAGRIIDISDEKAPKVISDFRLEVNQRENRAAIADDPGADFVVQGYAGHYCGVPQEVDPGIVACSFINSGLRVFDIRDPYKPKELAYFVAPPAFKAGSPVATPGEKGKSNYAMSKPSFVPERGEIWYSDGNTGFYALRVAKGVWPFPAGAPGPGTGVGPGGSGGGRRPRLALSVRPGTVRTGRTVRFAFRVRRGTSRGAPVRGAVVRFAGRAARTDARGRAFIIRRLGSPRPWGARATKPGFRRAGATVRAIRSGPGFTG